MVRVLTNGVQLAPPTTTYVTHLTSAGQNHQPTVLHTQNMSATPSPPKKKPKKKKQKLDLANIMKMSGIGNDDDVNFESDTSQSESEPIHSQSSTPQPQLSVVQPQTIQQQNHIVQTAEAAKKIGNIQISAVAQPTINTAGTPLVQVRNKYSVRISQIKIV